MVNESAFHLRINEQITAPTVRVTDAEGKQHGCMPRSVALKLSASLRRSTAPDVSSLTLHTSGMARGIQHSTADPRHLQTPPDSSPRVGHSSVRILW